MSSVHLRLSSRVPTGMSVDWNIVGRRAHAVSKIVNFSATGAYVHTPSPAPTGARLVMQLLTGGGVVPTLARVVRSDEGGMGVRFEDSPTLDVPFDVPLDEIDPE